MAIFNSYVSLPEGKAPGAPGDPKISEDIPLRGHPAKKQGENWCYHVLENDDQPLYKNHYMLGQTHTNPDVRRASNSQKQRGMFPFSTPLQPHAKLAVAMKHRQD